MNKRILCAALAAFSVILTQQAMAQAPDARLRAESFAQAGNAKAMELAYSEVLAGDPGNLQALNGRGTALSWQGRRSEARADFSAALSIEPENLEALTGLGYDYAWGKDYALAEETFGRALAIAPDALSVRKGLAFTALWSDQNALALERFSEILADNPSDLEALRATGDARLALGQAGRAEAAYLAAVKVAPDDMPSRSGIAAARRLPALLEVSVWAGNSAEGGDIGLRAAEVGSWVTPDTRLGVRYDNSLSLDNPALARTGVDAEAWFVAAQHTFADKVIAVAEIGKRSLPNDIDQEIFKLEGVLLGDGQSFKLGGQFSPSSAGYDDKLVYAGTGLNIGENFLVDATVYLSQSGATEDEEVRGAVFGEYRSPDRWTLGGGLGYGEVTSSVPGASGSVTTVNAIASAPIGGRHSVYLQARWEDAPLTEFSSVVLGVTFRLPRR
jgi:tetratricopeptide (TPR) repeat protein